MRRVVNAILFLALATHLVSCAATSGQGQHGNTLVQFSFEGLNPQTVRIAADGNVNWVNQTVDTQGFVVLPPATASAFTCTDLGPYFHKTAAGYQSLPITSYESQTVQLPCPLRPGRYPYQVWIMDSGLARTAAAGPGRMLSGTLVVE